MSQWGQSGFQYPMQTGFPGVQPQPQFQPGQQLNTATQFQHAQGSFGGQPGPSGLGAGFGGLAPQPIGFPGARPQGPAQPQQAGPPGVGAGFLQAQPTGFPAVQPSFQQRPPPPPIPPLPSYHQNAPPPPVSQPPSFLQANQSRLGAPNLVAQPTGVGFMPQPTGFAGRAPASLVPQVTGFVDPRLQMMSSSFMPVNVSAPYTSGGAPQLAPLPQQQPGGLSLQQSFQQHNQAHGRGTTPKIPWALSKAEKKQYDQIFRAWDAQGTGFINGQTALEVFGQSGLDRNDLARIWTLADADNRGKLNLAEFHVAMGLIYRRLNGNDVPDDLPAELVPPSSRDLDTSVNFLKDILKNDTRSRSPSGLDTPVSRLKERSFTTSSSLTQHGGRQDATVYKHEDVEPPGGFYQPRNRHVDRSTIRSRADDASPATADLSSIKRQLLNTQKMLDDTLVNEQSSDALDRELEDLRYRITRLQEDLEYVSKGSRTTAKDEERRRLERELVRLMHEEVPELEKKVEERDARREREKREWARDRDRRNERSGRYGDDDSERYSPASRYREEEDRPYSRSAPRFDRDDDRDRSYRDGDRNPNRDTDRDHGSSTTTRSPPPPPARSVGQPVPPPPAPARSPAPTTKNMTPEERQAFIRAEAQRRLEARKQALGVVTPASASAAPPVLDTTIEDRLAQEKKEAEEKAREAERQAEERQKQRREKLEAEKALKENKTPSPTRTQTAPPPAPAPTPAVKAVPTPSKRPPVPPPPRRGATVRNVVVPSAAVPAPPVPTPAQAPTPPAPRPPAPTPIIRAPVPPAPPAPVELEEDPEDVALRTREEALRRKREERAALLRRLEEEEEEARKAEQAYKERRNQFLANKATSAASVTSTGSNSPVPPAPPTTLPAMISALEEPEEAAVPPPPPPPPPPPAPSTPTPPSDKPNNNPFSRLMKEGGPPAPATAPTAATNGGSNPFFRAQTAPPAAPQTSKSPVMPPPVKTTYHTAPKDSDDDWDDVMEKDEDDSSDEELSTRDTRMNVAQVLFGGLLPSRPQSAAATMFAASPTSPTAPAPPPPPPSAPPATAAAPVPIVAPAPTGDRSALLSAIQGGARLRKTVTNDRSGAATSGRVIGGTAPPTHINAVARRPSPPTAPLPAPVSFTASPSVDASAEMEDASFGHGKRESVDWYNALAVDANKREVDCLPVTVEEAEDEYDDVGTVPAIQVSEHRHAHDNGSELMADVDLYTELRVRSLYPYASQRAEDLDVDANTIIIAHPSKSGSDWWYGTMIKNGKAGFFPQTYVQKVQQVHATALYPYTSTNADELSFNEGDVLTIVDRSESDWWKVERDGLVFIVPAAFLEVTEGLSLADADLDRVADVEPGPGLAWPLGLPDRAQGFRQGSTNEAEAEANHHADHDDTDDGAAGTSDRCERVTADVYSTPYTSPQAIRRWNFGRAPGELPVTRTSTNEDEIEDEDEGTYYSLEDEKGADRVSENSDGECLDESGDDDEDENSDGDSESAAAREIERRRVFEAAGLVVSAYLPADGTVDDGRRTPPSHVRTAFHDRDREHAHDDSRRRHLPAPPVLSVSSSGGTSFSLSEFGEFSPGGRRRLRPRPRPPPPPAPLGPRGLPRLSAKDLPPIPTLDLPDREPSSNVLSGAFGAATATATPPDLKDKQKDDGDRCGGGGGIRHGDGTGDIAGEEEREAALGSNHHFKTRSDGNTVHLDDAFERYETFKKMQASHIHTLHGPSSPHSPHAHPTSALSASASRMSMSSFETGSLALSSPPRSPAASMTPSLRERESGESRASQFLSFLGRHTRASTPDNNHHERDRKLVISGPIPISHVPSPSPVSKSLTSGGDSGPVREDDPAFGSSWASLVDRSALEGIPKEERKRQEAIFELISTEADYVRDVQLIVELFYSQLMEVLDKKSSATIFSNIEDILLTNTTFLSTLEERQRDCRLYVDRIGDLLEKHMPNMAVYLTYCVNQARAGKALQQMRETNPTLATQLQTLREDPSARNLDLSSYLLVPMQRLTRYPLLIRQILHYTDSGSSPPGATEPPTSIPSDERKLISTALKTGEKILEDVNETIREREGRERLGEISRSLWIGQGRLDLTAPTRYLGARKLIKEGVLNKAKSGRKLRVFLCNDILVLVDEVGKGLYHVPIPVHEIEIKVSRRTARDDPLLRLHVAYPRGGDMIVLRAPNTREAKAWEDAILDVRAKAREGIATNTRLVGWDGDVTKDSL